MARALEEERDECNGGGRLLDKHAVASSGDVRDRSQDERRATPPRRHARGRAGAQTFSTLAKRRLVAEVKRMFDPTFSHRPADRHTSTKMLRHFVFFSSSIFLHISIKEFDKNYSKSIVNIEHNKTRIYLSCFALVSCATGRVDPSQTRLRFDGCGADVVAAASNNENPILRARADHAEFKLIVRLFCKSDCRRGSIVQAAAPRGVVVAVAAAACRRHALNFALAALTSVQMSASARRRLSLLRDIFASTPPPPSPPPPPPLPPLIVEERDTLDGNTSLRVPPLSFIAHACARLLAFTCRRARTRARLLQHVAF